MPNGSDRITSHPLQELQPTKSIEDDTEIKGWLALATKKKKSGGKKKKGLSSGHLFVMFLLLTLSFIFVYCFEPNIGITLKMVIRYNYMVVIQLE